MVQKLAATTVEKGNLCGAKPRFCDQPNNSIQKLAVIIAEKDNSYQPNFRWVFVLFTF